MHASALFAAAALWATAKAIPAPTAVVERAADMVIEKRADQTAAWVTVDDEGQPAKTYSPSMTVVDGTTSVQDAAPHDLTASVFTITNWGEITTSTGDPPLPTATSKNGAGVFARCSNLDGDNAPFCDPAVNGTLFLGSTYYITWDPQYYNKTSYNTTWEVAVRLDYLNHTSKEWVKLQDFDRVPAAWGFWPFYVDSKYMTKSKNISITLLSSEKGSAAKQNSTTLPLFLSKPLLPKNHKPKVPHGQELTIALPTVFGAIVLLLVGGCLWNRKTRKISLSTVMGRNRGYSGRAQRRGRKNHGIQLDTRGVSPPTDYRDTPERPRRDSDALGSLANSPIDSNFQQHGTSGRNAFRDEIRRQEHERQ